MPFRFRPTLDRLDARDLPSTTPLDPDLTGSPPNEASVLPFTEAQLATAIADGDVTLLELEALLGLDIDGDTFAEELPAPAGQPQPPETAPPPRPVTPFNPIPPLWNDDNGIPLLPTPIDATGIGGRKSTDAEAAEVVTLVEQQKQLGKGRAKVVAERARWREIVSGANVIVVALQQDVNNGIGSEESLARAKRILDNMKTRITYLDGKLKEMDDLKKLIEDRVNEIYGRITRNVDPTPALNYTLPQFIDWNSKEWLAPGQPVPLQATAPGM